MPSLSQISNNFFLNLINRLGVRPPPPESFLLSNVVHPVSIVDSDITLSAIATTQLLDTPFTIGASAAPALNTVLADTGAQPLGNYSLLVIMTCADPVNSPQFQIQRRDAANAVTIWSQIFYATNSIAGNNFVAYVIPLRISLLLNERIRILNSLAGGAGSVYQASIWLTAS